jgi:hypothetical protein
VGFSPRKVQNRQAEARATATRREITMASWSMDNWRYVERQAVTDPKGREWSVALMDILGQEGDPEMPSKLLELQYSSGRFFTLIYSASGVVVYERGYPSLPEATNVYERLIVDVMDGVLDPSVPVFREDLED